MSAPPLVRAALRSENAAMVALLTDAFVDEAALNYWLKQGAVKDRARRTFFDAVVEDAVHPDREIHVAECDGEQLGAAVWLGPGKKAYDLTMLKQLSLLPRMLAIAGLSGMNRGFALADKLEHFHPKVPHAHLAYLGVLTRAQGRGVGSELLKQTLAPLDANGTVAFLECSTERNAALYERHGFEVTGEFDAPGLHVWTMTRQPRR